jgi:tetratricopeptide (TPR) repeat protein
MMGVVLTHLGVNLKNRWIFMSAVLIICLFSIRTFVRSFDWRSDFTIATHDLKISKEAFNLEDELSFYYFSKKDYPAVRLHALNSVKIYPTKVGYNNLGAANFFLGNFKDAMDAYKESLRLGDYQLTYDNLSSLYLVYGDKKEGIMFVKNALMKYPKDSILWLNLARLEYKYGNKESAKNYIKEAYELEKTIRLNIITKNFLGNKNNYFWKLDNS